MDGEAEQRGNSMDPSFRESSPPPVNFLNPNDIVVPPGENAEGIPPFMFGAPMFEGPPLSISEEGTIDSRVLYPPLMTTSTTTAVHTTSADSLTNATTSVPYFNLTQKYSTEAILHENFTTNISMLSNITQGEGAQNLEAGAGMRSLTTTEIIVLCTVIPAVIILFVMGVALWYFIFSKKRNSNRRVGVGSEEANPTAPPENIANGNGEVRPASSLSKTLHSTAPNTAASNGSAPDNAGLRQQAWTIESQTVPD